MITEFVMPYWLIFLCSKVAGALWENFIISERIKHNAYSDSYCNSWFWRTQQQKEIDYIEEEDGQISTFEFKWNPGAKYKYPQQLLKLIQTVPLK